MLSEHGVNDLTRSEHVRREVREGSAEGVLLVGLAKACQQSGGNGTAGKAEVVVLRCCHAMDVDSSRSGIASVICGHSVGWAIAINRGLAGGHIDGVGEIHRYTLPFSVCHYEGKGRNVMHGANAVGVGFQVLGPFLKVVTRIINERWGDAYQ